MHDVVVDEERLRADCKRLQLYCRNMEFRYRKYLDALRHTRMQVVVSGELADSLDAFLDRAEKLQNQFDNIADDFREFTTSYLREIDSVDDF